MLLMLKVITMNFGENMTLYTFQYYVYEYFANSVNNF